MRYYADCLTCNVGSVHMALPSLFGKNCNFCEKFPVICIYVRCMKKLKLVSYNKFDSLNKSQCVMPLKV